MAVYPYTCPGNRMEEASAALGLINPKKAGAEGNGKPLHYFPMRVMESKTQDMSMLSDPNNRRPDFSGDQGVKWATGQGHVGDQAPLGKYVTGQKNIQLRNKIRVGTWNVRGLLEKGKIDILQSELERCDMRVTGISETHWKDSGHFDTQKYTIYYSGNNKSSFAGVAIIIPKSWNSSVLGYNPISERLMTIKLSASPTPLNIVQVYAPTSSADDAVIEGFYNQLETCIAAIPKKELLLVIGDFNAKVGDTSMETDLRDVVGCYGLGVRNDRGDRLIQFAAENNLAIMNTTFKQHPRRAYTWISPDGKHRNQIDYILTRARWRSSICNAHTLPGADCLSDHQLLICSLKLKLSKTINKKSVKRMVLHDKNSFVKVIEQNQNNWHSGDDTPNSLWDSTKQLIFRTYQQTQPVRTVNKRQHWMSNDTWQLVEQRRNAKSRGADMKELNTLGSKIQAACRRDRNRDLLNTCMELEHNAQKFETKDLHMKIKFITRQFKPKNWAVENTTGTTVTEIRQIVKVWEEYCRSLFADHATLPNVALPSVNNHVREPSILKDEVRAAIKHLKCGKALGIDEIPIEVIKDMGEVGVDILHTICTRIWDSDVWPKDWAQAVFIPLHKKGSTKKCNNYRLISLISHASKVLLHILNTRLQAYLNSEIAPEQAGFVKGKGTREQILVLRQIIEKAREFNTPLFICFVDFRKAFDTVKWDQLWRILLEMGVPEHLVFLIKRLYENGTAVVRVDGVDSAILKTQAGVRQGCILSPLLFNTYTEYIMRIVLDKWTKGVSIGGQVITNLRYADDTTLLASSEKEIGEFLKRLEDISIDFGLAINHDKTKMMIVDRKTNNRPEIAHINNCQVVPSYIYLGSNITNNGSCENEIRRRCALTKSAVEKLSKIWRDKKITKNTKVRLMKCLVFPIFLYAAETWTLRQIDRRKIDALEMWCWRRLLRISWTAHRTNVSILKELKINQRLSSLVQLRILKFFGHIARKRDTMEHLVVQGRVEGTRSRGRSPTRWTDSIRATTNLSVSECSRYAANRSRWREIARAAVKYDP